MASFIITPEGIFGVKKTKSGDYRKVGSIPLYNNKGVSLKELPLPALYDSGIPEVPEFNIPDPVEKQERPELLKELIRIVEKAQAEKVQPGLMSYSGGVTLLVIRYGRAVILLDKTGTKVIDGCTARQSLYGTEYLKKVFRPTYSPGTSTKNSSKESLSQGDREFVLEIVRTTLEVLGVPMAENKIDYEKVQGREVETALGTVKIADLFGYTVMINQLGVIIDLKLPNGRPLYGDPHLDEYRKITKHVKKADSAVGYTIITRRLKMA